MQVANDGLRRKRPKQGGSKPRADREQYHEARGPARYSTSVSLFFSFYHCMSFPFFCMAIYYYFIKTDHPRIIKKADTSLRACSLRVVPNLIWKGFMLLCPRVILSGRCWLLVGCQDELTIAKSISRGILNAEKGPPPPLSTASRKQNSRWRMLPVTLTLTAMARDNRSFWNSTGLIWWQRNKRDLWKEIFLLFDF